MKLEELLLRKEELPILGKSDRPRFTVPIHPTLLQKDVKIDPMIAYRVFRQAAREYHQDLKAHIETVTDEQTKKWYQEVFLNNPIVFTDKRGRQTILDGMWEDLVQTGENGFAHVLSINRNVGGSLYFNEEDIFSCKDYISLPLVNFTLEKFKAYAIPKGSPLDHIPGARAYTFGHHNIDYYPGALFLRNWAVLYLNEAMKGLGEEVLNKK